MILGIMQPYFLPYIGYWQLMNAVDRYVIYDDVNFIKGGWINRNRILLNGEVKYFNVPMIGASSFKKINEIGVPPAAQWVDGSMDKLRLAYRNAPYYREVKELMDEIFRCGKENLAEFLAFSIVRIARWLEMDTEFVISSSLEKNNDLRGQEKVLAICELLKADTYYNAIGGQELYSKQVFADHGLTLQFLQTPAFRYDQHSAEFVPNLSILDVMMYCPKSEIQKMLNTYTLL